MSDPRIPIDITLPRITIALPRAATDEQVTAMRSWAVDIQAVFGYTTFVQRPYGLTFQEWAAQTETEAPAS